MSAKRWMLVGGGVYRRAVNVAVELMVGMWRVSQLQDSFLACLRLAMLAWLCLAPALLWADDEHCAICDALLTNKAYVLDDAVTLQKTTVCGDCTLNCPECFLCSLPVRTNRPGSLLLPDARVICARDARTAVVKEEEGIRVCRQVRDHLDHLLSRFVSFPETNVTVAVVDRVSLQDLFKIAGNDYHCPNVWGYTQTKTNNGQLAFSISILSGLPLTWFQATCAHEYTHAWMHMNVPVNRKPELDRDAIEGFCELVAWLLVDEQSDEDYKARILRNAYTRGQIDLFISAQKRDGFNDVLDWVKYGVDARLQTDDPWRVRRVDMPRPHSSVLTQSPPAQAKAPPLPESLKLKAVFWQANHPTALINDQTLAADEQGRVHLASTNLTIRCLLIRKESVRVRIVETGEEKDLELGSQ